MADPDSLLSANLPAITVPVLLLGNKGNTCAGTLASGNAAVKKALKMSLKVGIEVTPSAALIPLTDPCNPLSDHGFFGSEDTTVRQIALWIQSAP